MGDEADYLTDGEDYYDFFYGCYEEDEFESGKKDKEKRNERRRNQTEGN